MSATCLPNVVLANVYVFMKSYRCLCAVTQPTTVTRRSVNSKANPCYRTRLSTKLNFRLLRISNFDFKQAILGAAGVSSFNTHTNRLYDRQSILCRNVNG
jgi:hypothetical protein